MERKHFPVVVFLITLFLLRCAHAENSSDPMLEVVHLSGNKYFCLFEGVKHDFILDIPEKTKESPLVLMLPGYGNTAESFRSTVQFQKEANALGYAVAWVTGARNPNDPLSSTGWNSGIGADGNDDVAFLISLANYLQKEYSFDGKRTFVAGFSNGAFMAHRLAMEAGGTFSACVSVAGMMPVKIWNARKDTNDISFFQISGEMDDVIPKKAMEALIFHGILR
ncbi:MAG: prolyl oligopeptidase family serine peptidase [Oscillospiraceae bacterium]|nr:prolyl oligopeptidase family serine peptidase [Oscillospiraceae bacterium]